tara:strand:- start:6155 stop:6703 length:549 start_codon:yes stop_codon:yes gene_type:complete
MHSCAGYAIDNGAWVYFKRNQEYDSSGFLKDVKEYGANADFVVIPDVVEDKDKTLEMSEYWIKMLSDYRLLLVAQDGVSISDLEMFTKRGIGIFIGGSTDWKLSMIKPISDLCRGYDVLCHVGRVNTLKRLRKCVFDGAHSFDGSGMARFVKTAEIMTRQMIHLDQDLFANSFDAVKERYCL